MREGVRLEFATRLLAQAFADDVHSRMVANDSAYARSVASGQTLRWAIPYQDGLLWYVNLKQRADKILTTVERTALKTFNLAL